LLNGLAAHKYLLFFVLLTFLFSTNALSFGRHAEEEMHQAMKQIAALSTLEALSAENAHAVFAHHHGHHDSGQSENHDSNESHHSHDTEAAPLAFTVATLASSSLRFFEPFSYIPEVFFDRFIPPKNHA
jgi:hypothetical protein